MRLFSLFKGKKHDPPPEWSAAPEPIHAFGKHDDAPDDEYQAGEEFCTRYPVSPPALLPSNVVERIRSHGPKAWGMEAPSTGRFKGSVTRTEYGTTMIETKRDCLSTCVLSDLPISAGLYDVPGDMEGVYFEVAVKIMQDTVAIGTACRPYPDFRLPGWNRLSAGFHLDDLRKFFEDPDGGRDYVSDVKEIREGDVVGCGYEFGRGAVFFTYNGRKLADAFVGVYVPRTKWDVYAAVGVSGQCGVQMNFGGEEFKWKEANSGRWRVPLVLNYLVTRANPLNKARSATSTNVVQRHSSRTRQKTRSQHVSRKTPTTPAARDGSSSSPSSSPLPTPLHEACSVHLHPPPPSSDDDNQPALVRYARLKQREQATSVHPGAPLNPERWSVKDTSVNVATAFHQAATSAIPDIIDMQTVPDTTANSSWASSTSTRPPRSTSVEYEKETQSISLRHRLAPPPSRINPAAGAGLRSDPNNTHPSARRPLTKSTTSATLVPDSEAENELDINGRAKSPFNQVVDAAKRALAPATFYLRQRSQEPDGAADRSTASNHANGQHSSYDYSAEEREFQANMSQKPSTTSAHRKNRMSIDKKAYKPSLSDDEGSEEWSDDGKGRRRIRKKKKHEPLGGPLTTLPVMSADKRKRRRSKGKTGEEDGGSESEENVTEKASNERASVSRQSVRGSVPPEPIGDVSLDDAEQGLHSIPEVELEDVQVEEEGEEEAHHSERRHSPHAAPAHSVPFSVGAFLGRLVNVTFRTCINFLILLVNLLSGLFFVFGRIFGTIVEILFFRPLKILGLIPLSSTDSAHTPKPVGKYLLIGFAILAIWFAIQEPNKSIPISLPSVFTGKSKKHDPVYVAPGDLPTDFSQLVARLQAIEYAYSQLADDRATSQDLRGRLDELAEIISREARERKRAMDTVDGKVRDVVRDGVQSTVRRVEEVEKKLVQDVERVDRKVGESLVKEVQNQVANVVGEMASLKREIEALRAKLAASAAVAAPSGGKKEPASDEEARNRLRVLEERLVEMEDDVKDAIELGKKAAVAAAPTTGTSTPWWTKFSPSKGSSSCLSEGITIKSTDGQDITALLDQLITSSVLTHVHKDGLAKTDYARFSAGARVIPSLTSPTLEIYPTSWTSQVLAYFTRHGTAVGRPPVVALHHEVYEGFCWPFKGSEGQLGVVLAAPVKVESVTVDHVPSEVARDVRSAPKVMEVWGLVDGEENRRKVEEWKKKGQEGDDVDVVPYPPSLPREPEYIRLANFTYDIDGPSHIQNFPVDEEIREMDLDFGVVVLMVQSNWGRTDFTCLYRFRVHGTKLEEEVPVPVSLEGPESVEEMLV